MATDYRPGYGEIQKYAIRFEKIVRYRQAYFLLEKKKAKINNLFNEMNS